MAYVILVPTDGSDCAEKAADYAIDMAKSAGGSILFLNVVDAESPAFTFELERTATSEVNSLLNKLRDAGQACVDRLKQRSGDAGVQAETKVVNGHPWEEILAEASRSSADHIIMGSHGRRALKAAVIGSVAINVIHGAKVPITIIPIA